MLAYAETDGFVISMLQLADVGSAQSELQELYDQLSQRTMTSSIYGINTNQAETEARIVNFITQNLLKISPTRTFWNFDFSTRQIPSAIIRAIFQATLTQINYIIGHRKTDETVCTALYNKMHEVYIVDFCSFFLDWDSDEKDQVLKTETNESFDLLKFQEIIPDNSFTSFIGLLFACKIGFTRSDILEIQEANHGIKTFLGRDSVYKMLFTEFDLRARVFDPLGVIDAVITPEPDTIRSVGSFQELVDIARMDSSASNASLNEFVEM